THLTVEIGVLEREAITGANHDERINELKAARSEEEERLLVLTAKWESEKEIITRIQEIRAQLEAQAGAAQAANGAASRAAAGFAKGRRVNASAPDLNGRGVETVGQAQPVAMVDQVSAGANTAASVEALRAELARLNQELEAVQGETPL